MDQFKGEKIHSHDYRTSKGYENKRVVVVGIGNSGGDATVELSRVASQVCLRYYSIVNRKINYTNHMQILPSLCLNPLSLLKAGVN